MKKLKVVDGKVEFLLKTFDGSFVKGEMNADAAEKISKNAEEDASVEGYELVVDKYRFATEDVKMPKKAKGEE